MARALIGKKVADEVLVQTPEGEWVYDVIKIWYK